MTLRLKYSLQNRIGCQKVPTHDGLFEHAVVNITWQTSQITRWSKKKLSTQLIFHTLHLHQIDVSCFLKKLLLAGYFILFYFSVWNGCQYSVFSGSPDDVVKLSLKGLALRGGLWKFQESTPRSQIAQRATPVGYIWVHDTNTLWVLMHSYSGVRIICVCVYVCALRGCMDLKSHRTSSIE